MTSRTAPGAIAAAAFALQFGLQLLVFERSRGTSASSVLAVVESGLVWALLASLATTRRRRVILASLAAFLVVGQSFVFRFYQVPLDLQVAEAARHQWTVVRPVLMGMMPWALLAIALVGTLELALLELAAPVLARLPSRAALALACAAATAGLGIAPRRATPDVRALHAALALRGERPPPVVGAVSLPPLLGERATAPDVLFVLTESVRAEDYEPATTLHTRALIPERVDLAEMRAVSSYTVLSLSAVLTGRSQEERRDDILRAPNLFDYARASGARVGYWSGHSREIFETKDVRAAVDRFVTLETLAGREVEDDSDLVVLPLDRMLVDRFIADLPGPADRAASFSILHLASTHAPYWFDDARAPFAPHARAAGWSDLWKLRNAYRNAILEQDLELARGVKAFVDRAASRDRPWLVVFTSDHGEAFGEHGAIHHGQNLYDEQVHVPGWVAFSPRMLEEREHAALVAHRDRFVTHLDLVPTLLDALGLGDSAPLRPHRDRLRGRSLLRPPVPRAPLPVTNCTEMFRCPLNTWGLYGEDRKLVSQAWDGGWWCLSLRGGERMLPLDEPGCAALREASRATFPLLPNGQPNR